MARRHRENDFLLRLTVGLRPRSMRVVIVTSLYPPDIGGPATHSRDLVEVLRGRGHDLRVVTLGEKASSDALVVRLRRGSTWLKRFWAVVRWLVAHRDTYDVVYATGLHAAAALGAAISRRPRVLKFVADPAWERAVRRGLTKSDCFAFQTERSKHPTVVLMRGLRSWAARMANAVVVPSLELQALAEAWAPGRCIRLVPNGVRTDLVPHAHRDGGGPLVAIAAGRLVPVKRYDVIIRAVRACPGVTLRILGDGPQKNELKSLAGEDAGTKVVFEGQMPHDAALEALAQADVLLVASEHEGLSHTALEAVSSGTPIIARDIPAMRHVVRHGQNGLLVPGDDVAEFARALHCFVDDQALRARLVQGTVSDRARWSFDRTADAVERVLDEVCSRPKVVVVGKSRFRPGDGQEAKYQALARVANVTIICIGPPGYHAVSGVRVLCMPAIPPSPVGAAFFYAGMCPVAAIHAVSQRASAIICQSPLEASVILLTLRMMPRRRRPKLVVEVHGDWRTATRLYGGRARRLLAPIADRASAWSVRNADHVRSIGSFTTDLVRETGYTGEIDTFIAFGPYEEFGRVPLRELPPRPALVFAGALERLKSVDVLLEAWASATRVVQDGMLYIVGDGSQRSALETQIDRLGLTGRVAFTGHVPRERLLRILDEAWALTLPSRSEGLGRVIIESFLRARPVIASAVGGVPELVGHESTGLLVPPGDPVALRDAIVRLLTDADLTRELGQAAHAWATEQRFASEFESGFRRLILKTVRASSAECPARRS